MTQLCTANTLKTYPFTKCFSGWVGGEAVSLGGWVGKCSFFKQNKSSFQNYFFMFKYGKILIISVSKICDNTCSLLH